VGLHWNILNGYQHIVLGLTSLFKRAGKCYTHMLATN